MVNANGRSSKTSGQPSNNAINLLLNLVRERKEMRWRSPVFLSMVGLVVLLLVVGVYFGLLRTETSPQSPDSHANSSPEAPIVSRASPSSLPEVATSSSATADLPPLYPQIQWSAPEKITFFIPDFDCQQSGTPSCERINQKVKGVKVTSAPMNEADLLRSFQGTYYYYSQHFTEDRGWIVYISRFTSSGEVIGWKKGEIHFSVSYSVDPSINSGFIEIWHN